MPHCRNLPCVDCGFLEMVDLSPKPAAEADQRMWGSKAAPGRFDNTGSFETSYANLRATYLRRIEVLDRLFTKKRLHTLFSKRSTCLAHIVS